MTSVFDLYHPVVHGIAGALVKLENAGKALVVLRDYAEDIKTENDELRRQRDEALQALQVFVNAHRHNVYSNSTYTPYVEACRILAQYDKDKDA